MNFLPLKSGTSVAGDEIKVFRTELKGSKYIYLIAGVHGDEVEGVYLLQQLFSWLSEEEELELPLIVIPILNVDGYMAATRVNAQGVDLNRNYPSSNWSEEIQEEKYHPGKAPLSEPENIFLDKLFAKFNPKLIISIHSWKPMINYNGDCKKIAELLNQYNSYPICSEIEGYSTPGSLGEYGPEKYNCPVLTFECPPLDEDNSLKDIWEENAEGLKKLFKSDLLS